MIYLNMPVGGFYGWAICGKHLLEEFAKDDKVWYIEDPYTLQIRTGQEQALVDKYRHSGDIDGTLFCTVEPGFKFPGAARGKRNIGYVFYEDNKISREGVENAKKFDIVVAGSEWNAMVLQSHGIKTVPIQQGVDQGVFGFRGIVDSAFTIFVGGKWEHRKGQDLALEAIKKAQKKYKDINVVVCCTNVFSDATGDIANALKGIQNIAVLGLMDQNKLSELMGMTDLGLFLNRCEGGTNLVLMEYLSTGRAAVVNVSTGQRDVSSPAYAYEVEGSDRELVDSTVEAIYEAYLCRDKLAGMGKLAHVAMGRFPWAETARKFLCLR